MSEIADSSGADPLLDEHFRRSLGAKNYQALFDKKEENQDEEPKEPKKKEEEKKDDSKDPVQAFQEDMDMEGYTGEAFFTFTY